MSKYSTTTIMALLQGTVAPGFEPVQAAFAHNFSERGELGAACTIYHEGQKVVDLWFQYPQTGRKRILRQPLPEREYTHEILKGQVSVHGDGYRDEQTQTPWQEDTMVIVYSATKGIAALTLALAHSRGLFDYDAPLATYWPEFAQNGKQHITIRQLLAHEAGLSVIDEPLNVKILADPDALATILARQKPAWEPGTRWGYHAFSLGWYECELLRRVDPHHRTLGQFFRDEIAQPLNLEFYIGVPTSVQTSRIATPTEKGGLQKLFVVPPGLLLSMLNPRSLTMRTFRNPKVSSNLVFNSPEYRAIEFPSAGGIGQASSIAKLYSIFATGGHELGITPETLALLAAPAIVPTGGPRDLVLHTETSFSLGFLKPFPGFRFGNSETSYGMPGSGGSFGFADPDAHVGFAYVTNKQGPQMWNDPREKALREAFYHCLKGGFLQS